MTYENALATYRRHHPDGPEPFGATSETRLVNGLGTNWHLRAAAVKYIATVKNARSPHGEIGYGGPRGRNDRRERSIITPAKRSAGLTRQLER